MKDECPGCSLRFEREEGFFLGAYVVSVAVTEGALALFIAVGFALTLPDPPVGWLIGLAAPLVVITAVLSYPFSKTTWAAIDFLMHPR